MNMWRCGMVVIGCVVLVVLSVIPSAIGALEFVPVGTFEILPGDSSVTFAVPDNRGGFTGRTAQVTGRVVVGPQGDGGAYVARVDAVIDAASITTGNGSRDASMRSEFLRTGQFPTITFKGVVNAIPGLAIRPFSAAARGQLTIRDKARDVEFPATITALAHEYLADATATVRMADFGIPYPRAFIFVARDPVTVTLHIRAR